MDAHQLIDVSLWELRCLALDPTIGIRWERRGFVAASMPFTAFGLCAAQRTLRSVNCCVCVDLRSSALTGFLCRSHTQPLAATVSNDYYIFLCMFAIVLAKSKYVANNNKRSTQSKSSFHRLLSGEEMRFCFDVSFSSSSCLKYYSQRTFSEKILQSECH